jgi:signal transduction histidine kinase
MLARPRPLPSRPLAPDDTPRILLVDDDPVNLMLLERILAVEYSTHKVSSGHAALEALQQEPYDLVLLDIMMPMMDGLEVLGVLRAQETTASLPVILISARSDNDDIVLGLQRGANDYITKPVKLDIVRARVRTQITLKRLSDQQKRHIAELQAARETQDNFYRIVSHDLKGPITNLRMAHYLLREMLGDHGQVGIALEGIDQALNDMQELITTFLDTAALRPGQIDLAIECLDAADACSRVIEQQRVAAAGKGSRIAFESVHRPIYADARRLNQILANLISNAVKYSPPGAVVSIWLDGNEHWTRICVADQGPGIPEAEREKLFQMFSKLSTRPTGGESSHGLGLWIVRVLAEAMHGTVGVECPPDGGSIFYLDLPACD